VVWRKNAVLHRQQHTRTLWRESGRRQLCEKAAQDAKCVKIDAVVARLDVHSIEDNPGTNAELDLQLEWHRRRDNRVPKKKDVTKKADKVKALVEAVEQYNNGQQASDIPIDDDSIQIDVPTDLDEEESDWE